MNRVCASWIAVALLVPAAGNAQVPSFQWAAQTDSRPSSSWHGWWITFRPRARCGCATTAVHPENPVVTSPRRATGAVTLRSGTAEAFD